MADELTELLDNAIYKEISSQAFYIAGQNKTEDPGAKALLIELAEQELKHAELLKGLKAEELAEQHWYQEKVPNLRISEYLTSSDTVEGAGLQETLILAMKREQQSVEFYSKMMGVLRDKAAKYLCEKLVQEELRHKLKLEMYYDDLFYGLDEEKQWEKLK
jgi:rubrerythrin